MTSGELGAGLTGGPQGIGATPPQTVEPAALAPAQIIGLVDGLLSERGRRQHLFAWLKQPGGGREDWLPVDAYYPANRVVVVCQDNSDPSRQQLQELVPAHGLRLMLVDPGLLPGSREAALRELEARIAELGPVPGRLDYRAAARVSDRAARKPAEATSQAATQTGEGASGQPALGAPAERQLAGLMAGLALIAILVVELYVGVVRLGLDSGRPLLALAFSLDAGARALGTLAAGRAGSTDWAVWCELGGSPVVAGYALYGQDEGLDSTEPTPVAGVVGLVALFVLGIALLSAS